MGIAGVVVGVVLTAVIGEWRARSESLRRRDDEAAERLRTLNRERIQQARQVLVSRLEWLGARAVGDADKLLAIDGSIPPWSIGFIDLLGDEQLIREYGAILVTFESRIGSGLTSEEVKRLTMLEVDVIRSLNRQEERIVKGEPLIELSEAAIARLFDSETGLTANLHAPSIPPTLIGRLAAFALRWRDRQR
jgi:hypothetical protein